jgi:carboxymethylenebutenolidase
MKNNLKTWLIIFIIAISAVGGWYIFNNSTKKTKNYTDKPNSNSKDKTTSTYFYNHSDELKGEMVNYYQEQEDIDGYLATPEGVSSTDKAPGIILVHEWWGLNEDIKQMADDYASEGYVALAVDLYGQEPTTSSSVAQQRSSRVRENMDEAMNNLGSAVEFLENREDVDNDKLATVGWCFGGGWAYQMAVNDIGVDASVMYYGQFDPQDDYQNMKSSILGHFGEEDRVVDVNNAREFKAKLEKQKESSSVYIYPNVGHSFANYQGGDNLDYSREKAKKAWNRTLNFLQNRLDLEQSSSTASTENYLISAEDSQAEFRLGEVLRGEEVTVVGTTSGDDIEGSIEFNQQNPDQTRLNEIKIDARTFATDSDSRDSAIQSYILETDEYPYITFNPKDISGLPETFSSEENYGLDITGDLTVKDTTREVTFDAKISYSESEDEISGVASTTIEYANFGISIPDLDFIASIEDQLDLKLDFTASK